MAHFVRSGAVLAIPFLLLAALCLMGSGGGLAYADGEGDPAAPSGPGMDAGMGDGAAMGEEGEEEEEEDGDEADGPVPFKDAANKAILRGVAWLKGRQLPDGSWGLVEGNHKYDPNSQGDSYKHPAGTTGLALYALLKCHVPMTDPVVRKGFKFLKERHKTPGSSYEVSAVLLAVTATADPFKRVKASAAAGERIKLSGEMRTWAQDLVTDLVKRRGSSPGWRYNVKGSSGGEPNGLPADLSSTQFAALALFAAERCGIKTDSKVWNSLITFAMGQQEDDGPLVERAIVPKPTLQEPTKGGGDSRYGKPGEAVKDKARGFAYIKNSSLPPDEGEATGGMTACGLGTILLARYVLGNRKDKMWEERDKGGVQTSLFDGAAWLDANWSASQNPKKQKLNVYHIYYMYCVERAMDLIGNQLLGKHLWYQEMGAYLVGRQKPQGFWNSDSTHKPEDVLDTCFALLFLKRSTKGGFGSPSITNDGSSDEPLDNRGK